MNRLMQLTPLQRALVGGLVVVMVLVACMKFAVTPRKQTLATLTTDVAQLTGEVTILTAKVKKLDVLIAENQRLRARLAEQRRQLPEEHEIANLLKQVTDLGARSGLIFRLWRPGTVVPSESGLYQELPVAVEVAGSYHQLGIFFEQVAQLDRIVAIGSMELMPERDTNALAARFTATAYAAPPASSGTDDTQGAG